MARRRQHGEGSVYQRSSDGRWIATVSLGWKDGKRERRVFTSVSMADAVAKRQRFLDRRRDGFTMPKGRQPYVSEWVLHWFHNACKREVDGTTWQGYRSKVELWIVPFFERIVLPELEEEDIEDWHRWLEGRTSKHTGRRLSPSTIGQTHRILSTCIKAAVVRKRIARNPLSNVTPPQARRPARSLPSRAEVEAILARCETWPTGARWVVALKTGLRQGEALALRWSAVRLGAEPCIEIRESAARVGRQLVYKEPKSEKSKRTIPLTPDAAAALTRHRQEQSVVAIGGLVFTGSDGKPQAPWTDLKDWRALLADLGLPVTYGTHDCRRVVATMLLEEGRDVRVVQEILGHASPAFTQSVYQQVRPVLMRDALDVLDRSGRPSR